MPVESPTQNIETYLVSIMQPTAKRADSYVKNSEHLTRVIKDIHLDQNGILVSLDIKSLYSSIPINEVIEKIVENEEFSAHVIELANHCLKNTYFMFNKQIYKQNDGAHGIISLQS